MKVYKISPEGLSWCAFDDAKKAAEEVQMLLENGDAPCMIRVKIVEMSPEEHEALPEHQGY